MGVRDYVTTLLANASYGPTLASMGIVATDIGYRTRGVYRVVINRSDSTGGNAIRWYLCARLVTNPTDSSQAITTANYTSYIVYDITQSLNSTDSEELTFPIDLQTPNHDYFWKLAVLYQGDANSYTSNIRNSSGFDMRQSLYLI